MTGLDLFSWHKHPTLPLGALIEKLQLQEEAEIPAPEEVKKVENEPKKASSPAMMWWKHIGDPVVSGAGSNTKEETDE